MTNRYHPPLPLASLALVLATPVATWWLVGDLTDDAARRLASQGVKLDYAFRPVTLGAVGDRIVGVLACVTVVATLAVLIHDTVARSLRPGWWVVLVPLVLAGVLVGFGWRVLTAGGIGANIGAGLMILGGGPVLAVLLLVAAVAAWRLRRH